jgi:hypothetical protein
MDAKHDPFTPSLSHAAQSAAATVCRDAYAGPLHVRSRAQTYLPQFPGEDHQAYHDRLNTSVFYDAFARAVDGLTGIVFADGPDLASDLPDPIHELWENVDLLGTHGSVFARERHRDGEVDGHFLIFVDMQRASGEIRSLADERAARLRPYWIGIRKQDVLAADFENVNGSPTLVHFRYRETVTERDGYAQTQVEQVREYNLTGGSVEYIVWRKKDRGAHAVDSGTMSIDEIPVSVGYHGDRQGVFHTDPPLVALALENFKHYQLCSDNDNILHKTCVPVFVRIGYERADDEQTISPTVGMDLPMGGDAKFVSPDTGGLDAVAKRIDKSEYRMSVLGLSMLMTESRQQETATSKRITKSENDSALASHARGTQDALEEAIRLTAKWMGLDLPKSSPDARWVNVSTDFEPFHLDSQTIMAISTMVEKRQLSLDSLWDALKRGGVLDSAFDAEAEQDRIEQGDAGGLEALRRMVGPAA